jgi:hypothetical protein
VQRGDGLVRGWIVAARHIGRILRICRHARRILRIWPGPIPCPGFCAMTPPSHGPARRDPQHRA